MKSDLGYPPEMEPAIQEELTVLASIEIRYHDELARLECLPRPHRSKTTFDASLRLSATLRGSRTS
jgi:hypothetical protein